MKVHFWGTRGSIPTPGPKTVRYGGNTSCIEIRTESDDLIILDAGSGIRELGLELARRMPITCSLFISHTHWDHIHGLPFFIPAFVPGNRLEIYGAPDPVSMRGIKEALAMQMEHQYFPVLQSELKADIDYKTMKVGETVTVGSAKVTSILMNHTVLTFGYRIDSGGTSIFYSGDHEPYVNIYEDGDERFEDYQTAIDEKQDEINECIRDVDVMVFDAQYTEEEYPQKQGWGHSTFDSAVKLAKECNVGKVYLIHHDPVRSDDELDGISARLRRENADMEIHMAKENDEIVL